jgi:hypothetical protein
MRARNYEVESFFDPETNMQTTTINSVVTGTEREFIALKQLAPELWQMSWSPGDYRKRGKLPPQGKPYYDSGHVSVMELISVWNGWGSRAER